MMVAIIVFLTVSNLVFVWSIFDLRKRNKEQGTIIYDYGHEINKLKKLNTALLAGDSSQIETVNQLRRECEKDLTVRFREYRQKLSEIAPNATATVEMVNNSLAGYPLIITVHYPR